MKKKSNTLLASLPLLGAAALAAAPAASALTLQEVVRDTLQDSPDVRITANERMARKHALEQAKAGYYPTVDVTAGYGREWSENSNTLAPPPPDDVTLTRTEAGIQLRQMLFDGFGTANEVDRQRARIRSAAYSVSSSAENTGLNTVDVYLNLLKHQRLVALAEDNLEAHQRIHDQIKLRADRGVGRKAELDQIRGRLALARSNLIAAKANREDARTDYLRVVGELPDEKLERPPMPTATLPDSSEQAVQRALDNHPTLQSANADVEAVDAQYEAAKQRYYPRFDLELSRTWNNNIDGVEEDDEDWQAMVRMRFNIFNGGADMARRKEVAYLINEAKEVRSRTHRQVVQSMRLSWNAYQATGDRLDFLQEHVEASEKTREAYTQQFNLGQRTLLDLLDTENELFEANQAYIEGDTDHLFAAYRVTAGMGRLLETVDVSEPAEAQLTMEETEAGEAAAMDEAGAEGEEEEPVELDDT